MAGIWIAREAHPQAQLQRLHFISLRNSHPCGFSLSASTLAGTGSVGRTTSGAVANALARLPSFIARCRPRDADLWFGDINELTSQLDDSSKSKSRCLVSGRLCASENPDMWTQNLFNAMAALARPGGTLATFTSAGFVRCGFTGRRIHRGCKKTWRLWAQTGNALRGDGTDIPLPAPRRGLTDGQQRKREAAG